MSLVPPESKASGGSALFEERTVAARDSRRSTRSDVGADYNCTLDTEPLAVRAAPGDFENRRSVHSARAEAASRLRPPRKTRSALSAEFDGAMERLALTNTAIADRCGVTVKTVRQWRGRDLLPDEVAKPIPSDMLVHLPDELFQEMYFALRGLRVVVRQEAREGALQKSRSK